MQVETVLSVVGFGALLLADAKGIRERSWTRRLLLLSTIMSLSGALLWTISQEATSVDFRSFKFWLGGVLTLIGGLFSFYTVFVEIPLWQKADGNSPPTLVTKGTYAACRHPGFWGTTAFVLGLSLAVPAPPMWNLAIVWVVLELIVVFIQDRWIFPSIFSEYTLYRQHVPFLLPTRESIREALQSFRDCKHTL